MFTGYARSAMLSTEQHTSTKRKLFFQPKKMRYNNLSHYLFGPRNQDKGTESRGSREQNKYKSLRMQVTELWVLEAKRGSHFILFILQNELLLCRRKAPFLS